MLVANIEKINHFIHLTYEDVKNWRRFLHQNAELSFKEYKTSNYIEEILKGFPMIEICRPTPTSVMATLRGSPPEKSDAGSIVAIRADIDALPIGEENNFSYSSQNQGVMHACGHDGHTAILLGTAKVLSELRDQFNGEIRFIFQHAEELPPGGGEEMVRAGVLEGVQYIIAGHLWSEVPVGIIGISDEPMMAAPDNFKIIVNGRGGHAAHPEHTIDPIIIGTQIVTNLQNIRTRLTNPLDPLVISITQFHGGSAYNIIPDSVFLEGTVRTFNPELRKQVPNLIKKITQGICSSYGAEFHFEYIKGYDPVVNDPFVNSIIKKTARKLFGENSVVSFKPSMGGEDFSAYLKRVPGSFFIIGTGNEQKGLIYPHHHPRFEIDENSLLIGLQLYVNSVLELINLTK